MKFGNELFFIKIIQAGVLEQLAEFIQLKV